MMRYLKLLFLGMLVCGLMAGSAFAGNLIVNGNPTPPNPTAISLEAMGAARNVVLNGSGNTPVTAALGYQTTPNLVSGDFFQVTFTNATFPLATPFNLCANNGANPDIVVAGGVSPGAVSTYNFSVGTTVLAGSLLYLTTAPCGAPGPWPVTLRFPAGCTPTTPNYQVVEYTSGMVVKDPVTLPPPLAVARIRPEYAAAANVTNYTIDYFNNPLANGTQLQFGAPAGIGPNLTLATGFNSVQITQQPNDYRTNSGAQFPGAPFPQLDVGAIVSVTDTANWQGVTRVYLQTTGLACIAAGNIAASVSPPVGTVALNVSGVAPAFNGTLPVNYDLCVTVNGTTPLIPRTISESVNVNVAGLTPYCDPEPFASLADEIWGINAFQGWVPWVVNTNVVPTYCLFHNLDRNRTVNVIMDVNSSEGGVTMINQSLGSIAPVTSRVIQFAGSQACQVDPTTSTCIPGTTVDLTALGANARYNAQITVGGSPVLVDGTCIQTDPWTGVKRSVPLLTGNYLGIWAPLYPVPWKQ